MCVCVCVFDRLSEIVTSVGTSDIQTVLDLLTSMEDLTHVEELE